MSYNTTAWEPSPPHPLPFLTTALLSCTPPSPLPLAPLCRPPPLWDFLHLSVLAPSISLLPNPLQNLHPFFLFLLQILEFLRASALAPSISLLLNPLRDLSDMPLKSFYRYALPGLAPAGGWGCARASHGGEWLSACLAVAVSNAGGACCTCWHPPTHAQQCHDGGPPLTP